MPTSQGHPVVYALLWLTRESEQQIVDFFLSHGIDATSIERGMHLTVYYARCFLPGLRLGRRPVTITADVPETRLMVMAPGGESPRPDLDPRQQSIGIRLTKRNRAIDKIQALRQEICRLETTAALGGQKATTAWTNAFGVRRYQPHITVTGAYSGVPYNLVPLGEELRTTIKEIRFGSFEVVYRPGG